MKEWPLGISRLSVRVSDKRHNSIQLSRADALQSCREGQLTEASQAKNMLVPILQGCTMVALQLESWTQGNYLTKYNDNELDTEIKLLNKPVGLHKWDLASLRSCQTRQNLIGQVPAYIAENRDGIGRIGIPKNWGSQITALSQAKGNSGQFAWMYNGICPQSASNVQRLLICMHVQLCMYLFLTLSPPRAFIMFSAQICAHSAH